MGKWLLGLALVATTLEAQDPRFLFVQTAEQRCAMIDLWIVNIRGDAQHDVDVRARDGVHRPVNMDQVESRKIWQFAMPGFPTLIGKDFLDLTPRERKHLAKWLRRCAKKERWVASELAKPIAARGSGLVRAARMAETQGKEPIGPIFTLRDGWYLGDGVDGTSELTALELKNGKVRLDLEVFALYPGSGSHQARTTSVVLLLDGDGKEIHRMIETVTASCDNRERTSTTLPRTRFSSGVYVAMLTNVRHSRVSTLSSNTIEAALPQSMSKHIDEFLASGIEDLKTLARKEDRRIGYWMCRRLR